MKVVIDISESRYRLLQKQARTKLGRENLDELAEAVLNGISLPKGCDIKRIIPKRVNVQKWIYTECPNPNCNYELSTHHGDGYFSIEHEPDFCPNCGQALLWENEE